jgi:GntR family transcriptional regulator
MDQIKHFIASGELQPGDQLPTVRQLAADLRVNFNTVARSYRLLDEAGMISTQHGRGTYILGEPSPEGSKQLRREVLEGLTRRFLAEADRLGFSPDEVDELYRSYIQSWKADGSPPDDGER